MSKQQTDQDESMVLQRLSLLDRWLLLRIGAAMPGAAAGRLARCVMYRRRREIEGTSIPIARLVVRDDVPRAGQSPLRQRNRPSPATGSPWSVPAPELDHRPLR